MKNFKNLLRELKVADKKELKSKQRGLSFQVKADNADRELLEKKNKIKKINEVLKYRDPILETMSYEKWSKIEQNQVIVELDLEQAKMLYEADMFRASRVQSSAKARAGRSGRSGRSGSGRAGGGFGRKRKAAAKETGPPHAGEIVTAETTSGSPHSITLTKTISNPTSAAAVYLQLPAVSAATAYYDYVVKDGKGDAATNNITITSAGGTIDGSTSYVISTNYGTVHFITDGTEWFLY
jgi:hypothetical protein